MTLACRDARRHGAHIFLVYWDRYKIMILFYITPYVGCLGRREYCTPYFRSARLLPWSTKYYACKFQSVPAKTKLNFHSLATQYTKYYACFFLNERGTIRNIQHTLYTHRGSSLPCARNALPPDQRHLLTLFLKLYSFLVHKKLYCRLFRKVKWSIVAN